MSNVRANITLENDCGHDVAILLIKYDFQDEESFVDDKFYKYKQGMQKSIERYLNRLYFVFVNDIDHQYGFIVKGGGSYSYKGKGTMRDQQTNTWVEFKKLEDKPGKIGFYALLTDVTFYIEGEKYYLKENDYIYVDKPAGNYVVGYDKEFQNIIDKYPCESGISYYIAKGQVIVECSTNIIIKCYRKGDKHDPNPTQKTV